MPTLAQLGELPTLLSDSLLSASPLWKREVKAIKPLDLALFLRLHQGTPSYPKAVCEVETLKGAVMQAHIDDVLPESDLGLLDHDMPRPPFTSGELVAWLEAIPLARRRALLFALDMGLDPRAVMELTWRELRRLPLTQLATELARMMPRHIRLPYVFWDTLPTGAAGPLFGLHETALEVSQGLGFAVMRRLYAEMMLLDSRADADDIQAQLESMTGECL